MTIHLVNPSDTSFGTAVITPRWLYVLAAATGKSFGDPEICDETLEHLNLERIHRGDVVGIGIHTGNALRGYEVGRAARERGAWVVFGGIHSTLYSEEPFEQGGAHAVVQGRRRHCLESRSSRLRGRRSGTHLQWRKGRIARLQAGAVGSAAAQQLYVGVGADGARMRETLLVLFRMAHGWATPEATRDRQSSSRKS